MIPETTSTSTLALTLEEELKILQDFRDLVQEKGDEKLQKIVLAADDDIIMLFIRCRGYKIESTFERLQKLDYATQQYPEFIETIFPSRCTFMKDKENNARNVFKLLKNRDAKGRSIGIVRLNCWDPDLQTVDDIISAAIVAGLEVFKSIETQLNGIVIILDVKGFSFKQARNATPSILHKYAQVLIRACPAKIKGIHIINAPGLFNITLSLIKVLLPHKLRNRIYGHSSMKSLHKWIAPQILPSRLGGDLSDEDTYDEEIIDALFTGDNDDFYKSLINLVVPRG